MSNAPQMIRSFYAHLDANGGDFSALSQHIVARGELDGRRVTIWKARLEYRELEPVEVQTEGGKRMPYDAFLRGLR